MGRLSGIPGTRLEPRQLAVPGEHNGDLPDVVSVATGEVLARQASPCNNPMAEALHAMVLSS
jgi:hypothetical protein